MYLKISDAQYSVKRRIKTEDTVKFLSVEPDPGTVSGVIEMHRDDGFLMSEDNAADYARQSYTGTLLTLTNVPEPEPQPVPEPDVDAAKAARIADSKQMLEDYLLAHPLQWTDGNYYAITAEKQNQLTSKILSATIAAQTSTPYNLTWNDTGEVCKPWELADLMQLAFAIDARVTALVTYQQTKEVEIRNCETYEDVMAVVIDYDSVGKEEESGEETGSDTESGEGETSETESGNTVTETEPEAGADA